MSNLATIQPQSLSRSNPFEPDSIPQATQLCEMLSKSALVPSALRGKPQDIFIILATARELGIGPMQALGDINVIQGKPVFSADLMLSLCKRRPDVCKYIRLIESTEQRAVYETQRVGSPEPERFTFTLDDARKLGLDGKDNYKKQPKTMLRRRAAAALARETYQDLVRGYDPDEAEDFAPSARPVAPPPPAQPAPVEQHPNVAAAVEVLEAEVTPADPVAEMIVRIGACESPAQLTALIPEIKQLPSDRIVEVRAAYSARKEALS